MTADLADRLRDEGLEAGSWSNGPGDRYAAHAHTYDKVLVCASGSITFELPAVRRTVELRAGDRLDLPAGWEHGASVGGGGVTCLEAHLERGSLQGDPIHHPGWAATPRSSDSG